jgi:hypothetical protein
MDKSGFSTLRRAAMLVLFSGLSAQAAAPEAAICAVQQVITCHQYEKCERALPGAVNLPVLMKIDRSAGVIVSRGESGEERTSMIGTESGDDTVHILQGAEDGRPWSMRVTLETGAFTLTSADSDAGYVAFGLCSSTLLK